MKLYRKMLSDGNRPLVGDGRDMLGVRPRNPAQPRQARDVDAVLPTDKVAPGKGASAFDDPGVIPAHVQGEMWVIETDDLPSGLVAYQRGKNKNHYQIEPVREVELQELQSLLAATVDLWERADGGANS